VEDGNGNVSAAQSRLTTVQARDLTVTGDTLIAVGRQTVTSIHITVQFVGGKVIAFSYDTPAGNDPQKNGNAVHVWPVSAYSVPFNATPEASMDIQGNDAAGDQSIEAGVSIGAYVVGYAVGPETPDNSWSSFVNVVASAYISPAGTGGDPSNARSSSVQTQYIGENTLVFRYAFLDGFNPKAAGAWVGLWDGEVSPYAASPRWFAPITQTVSTSDAVLNGLQLAAGTSYTLALFASGFTETPKDLQLNRLASFVVFSGGT